MNKILKYKIIGKKNNRVIAENAIVATTFFERAIGLMFSKHMDGFDGLIINPCKSIHTFFMNYPIDVLFLDERYKIVKIKRKIDPWRITPIYFRATQVVELYGGSLSLSVEEKEELEFICIS